jgi:hypothetical protein
MGGFIILFVDSTRGNNEFINSETKTIDSLLYVVNVARKP